MLSVQAAQPLSTCTSTPCVKLLSNVAVPDHPSLPPHMTNDIPDLRCWSPCNRYLENCCTRCLHCLVLQAHALNAGLHSASCADSCSRSTCRQHQLMSCTPSGVCLAMLPTAHAAMFCLPFCWCNHTFFYTAGNCRAN